MNENNGRNAAETETNTPQKTYEQKQLDVLYDEFNQKLRRFYDECKILIDESSEENQRLNCDIETQGKELEKAQKKLSARHLLDGMGRVFAKLFNIIYSLPSEISVKQNLCKCLDTINDELKNRAITLIYDPHCDMVKDKNYKCLGTLSTSDKELIGKRVIDKVGFLIENEEIIQAEYYEYVKEEDGRAPSSEEGEHAQSYPFAQNEDFKLYQARKRDGRTGSALQIISKKMKQNLTDKTGSNLDCIFLDVLYRFPEGNEQFALLIEAGILYLDLYQRVPDGYGNQTIDLIEKFPLAEIQY